MSEATMVNKNITDLFPGGIMTWDPRNPSGRCTCCGLDSDIDEGDICPSCGWERDSFSEGAVWSSKARNHGANRMDLGGYRLGLWEWLVDRNKMFGDTIAPLNFIDPGGPEGHDELEKRLSKVILNQGARPEEDVEISWGKVIEALVVWGEIEIDIDTDDKRRPTYHFTAYERSDCEDSWQELLSQSKIYSRDEVENWIGVDIIKLDLKELVHPEYLFKILVALLLGALANAVSKQMVAGVFNAVEDKLVSHIKYLIEENDMDSHGGILYASEALHSWIKQCINGEEWMQYKY